MNSTWILSKQGTKTTGPVAARRPLKVTDLVIPAAFTLWALGISRTDARTLGQYGLPAVLPTIYYAGIALLVVSAAIELSRYHPSSRRMSAHAAALVIMLYATAPLVYPQGRYSWLYKTIGVVQYVNAHGALNGHIDIYQNWSGFFALAAWFGKVAGVASPLAYAKWSQLVMELAALPILYLIYKALPLTNRQRWVALLLYSASNWIAQDYFSPQSLGTIFSLGIMALTIRWLSVGQFLGDDQGSRVVYAGSRVVYAGRAARDAPTLPFSLPQRPAFVCCSLCLLYFILTFTHELSPYILAVQLGALALFRLLRPRWLPIILAAIAVGYLLPHFGFVNQKYGLTQGLGNFFGNVAPPAFSGGPVPFGQQVIERCAEMLSLGMWALAAIGGWLQRRYGRPILALALLACSPFVVLALQAYGQEGVLRVYLFSLPWTAALAATVLAPAGPLTGARGVDHWGQVITGDSLMSRMRGAAQALRDAVRDMARPFWRLIHVSQIRSKSPRGTLRVPLALGVVLALFFPSFFGDDTFNRMPTSEVATITSFMRSAPAGPLYLAIDNGAFDDTSRYNLFPLEGIFGSYSMLHAGPATPNIAAIIANVAIKQTGGVKPAYVMVAPSMIAYNQTHSDTKPASFAILLDSLARSPEWTMIINRSGTIIYELPPQVQPDVPRVRVQPSALLISPSVP